MASSEPRSRRPARGAGERFALLLATAGGVGFLPIAPGTFGSALAIPIFVLLSPIHGVGGGSLWWVTWLGMLAVGVWASDVCEPLFGRKDDGRIVWDEVVGQLLALAPLLIWPLPGEAAQIAAAVTGFVLFRCFDIAKPGPVAWAERFFDGGLGVMMDDVIAGALAAALLAVAVLTGMFGWI